MTITTTTSLICATPKNGTPTPKGKPEKKLPVPPPTKKQQAASATKPRPLAVQAGLVDDPKKAGIPPELQVQNRKPLTPEQQTRVDAAMSKRPPTQEERNAELRAAQKADRLQIQSTKRKTKAEKAKAVAAGKTTSMPLTGKDAMAAIKKFPPGWTAKKQAAKEAKQAKAVEKRAVENLKKAGGKVVAKVNAKVKTSTGESAFDIVIAMLSRKQGATRAELCKATGWKGVSVPGFARKAKKKLLKENRDGVLCYRIA